MNKLEFQQVLEYVRAGEKDSAIEWMLQRDPDGPEMLNQARLMYEVLGEQSSDPEEEAPAADYSRPQSDLDPIRASKMYKASKALKRRAFATKLAAAEPMSAARKLMRRAAGTVRELGELVVLFDKAKVGLSFELNNPPAPISPAAAKPKPELKDIEKVDSADVGFMDAPGEQHRGIDINGHGIAISISLPATLTAAEHLRIKVTDTSLGIPSRGLELIFIPETGPFVKIFTNSKGVAELPVPESSGALRFNGLPPQLLHIRAE